MKRDQYNNLIPNDLVLLEDNEMTSAYAEEIIELDWYSINHTIFISQKKLIQIIGDYDGLDAFDVYHTEDYEVKKISRPLKRYTDEDGFYF